MDSSSISEQIFRAGVDSVLPDKMIRSIFKLESDTLYISKHIFRFSEINHIFVIGAGKASALMAKEVETILGNRISGGHIVVKHGHAIDLEYIQVTEAGHPTPDSHGLQATSSIIDMIFKAEKYDLVICLISGGGSSLLADLPEDIELIDLIEMNQVLINIGATIHEINAVRKHVSNVKGGQLAKTIFPATLVSLILSDVIGDSLDVIASGPTSPDPTTFFDAINVLEKYCVLNQMPSSIIKHLDKGLNGVIPETPKPGDSVFDCTHNLIIGSNRIALEAAKKKAFEMGFQTTIVTSELNGDSVQVAEYIVQYAIDVQRDKNQQKPVCLLFGGETTVQVLGKGLGGRNQHLALCSSRLLENRRGITILAAGTDGNDGPTNAAGAVVVGDTYGKAMSLKIDPNKFINEFDSYHFLSKSVVIL